MLINDKNAHAKLFHIHIPKTAGTSLRAAFERAGWVIGFIGPDFVFDPAQHKDVELFSGHVGFKTLKTEPALKQRVITLLREPRDRILSYYCHLRKLHETGQEISERTTFAIQYDLEDFLDIKDHPDLNSDMLNTTTWQLIHDFLWEERLLFQRQNPQLTSTDLVTQAQNNLASFLLVGFQHRLSDFVKKLETIAETSLSLIVENDNPTRLSWDDISVTAQRRLDSWIEMDRAVYDWALTRF